MRPRFQGPFWLAVIVIFAVQLGIVFLLNKPRPVPVNALKTADVVYRIDSSQVSDLAKLTDPTLFVLANPNGFSGQVWMPITPLIFEPKAWTEPMQWLQPITADLGGTFTQYVQQSTPDGYQAALPEPALLYPSMSPTLESLLPSALRIEGDLSGRRLLNPEPLPPVSEAHTNSVIQVLVDPLGNVYSAVPSIRSGSTNDDLAVRIAFSKRFESIEVTGPNRASVPAAPMMTGTLIFEWRPASQAAPANP